MSAVLFYMIGLPGAGKTTFAQNFAKQLGIDHIYGDRIGYELFTHPRFTPDEVQLVRSTMEQRVVQGLRQGKSVVYDAMLHNAAVRQNLANIALSHGRQAVGIWLQTPEKRARDRAGAGRFADFAKDYKRIVPKEVFDRHLGMFEEPNHTERVIQLWGTATFTMQYASLRKQLRDMNISPW